MSLALVDDGSYETIHLTDVSDKGMSGFYNSWWLWMLSSIIAPTIIQGGQKSVGIR